MKPQKTMRDGI